MEEALEELTWENLVVSSYLQKYGNKCKELVPQRWGMQLAVTCEKEIQFIKKFLWKT